MSTPVASAVEIPRQTLFPFPPPEERPFAAGHHLRIVFHAGAERKAAHPCGVGDEKREGRRLPGTCCRFCRRGRSLRHCAGDTESRRFGI